MFNVVCSNSGEAPAISETFSEALLAFRRPFKEGSAQRCTRLGPREISAERAFGRRASFYTISGCCRGQEELVACALVVVVALLMAPVHDNSQFVGSHAAAEHVARCALITAARIGAALESMSKLGSAIEQRIAAVVRGVSVCRLYSRMPVLLSAHRGPAGCMRD